MSHHNLKVKHYRGRGHLIDVDNRMVLADYSLEEWTNGEYRYILGSIQTKHPLPRGYEAMTYTLYLVESLALSCMLQEMSAVCTYEIIPTGTLHRKNPW